MPRRAEGFSVRERRFLEELLCRASSHRNATVVLVGSYARETETSPLSDIDLVTIGVSIDHEPPPTIQLMPLTEDDLSSRLRSGDDFVQWALRFGMPLAGRSYWRGLKNDLLREAPWPDYTRKLGQAQTRLHYAEMLAEMGDLDASNEELRFALSHLARAQLLKAGEFPLSRPELPKQLRALGNSTLAMALERAQLVNDLGGRELASSPPSHMKS
jgi:hypothetical protein